MSYIWLPASATFMCNYAYVSVTIEGFVLYMPAGIVLYTVILCYLYKLWPT